MQARGLQVGDRVATFCATTGGHFEACLGVPAFGFVLHPLNIRMSDSDLADMVVENEDKALILDAGLAERFKTLAPLLAETRVRLILVAGATKPKLELPSGIEVMRYADFIAGAALPDPADIPDIQEHLAATICHTGGTTGRPKAVAYSHRSLWLQALNLCLADTLAIGRSDTVLPAVPFYHVNGWGLPYACAMAGAGIVLPGGSFRSDVLVELIEKAGVTIAAGVPTIWTDLLAHMSEAELALAPSLSRIATGGAAVPARLSKALAERGIETFQAWGMTETSSMSVIGVAQETAAHGPLGHPVPGLEIRTVGETGAALPMGGAEAGEVQVRGPTVIARYLGASEAAANASGWVATGDIGTIDHNGALTLTDRLKDAIKSGGEWIPAGPLEDAICALGWVREAAVIARPDPRFQERPFAVIAIDPAHSMDAAELGNHLRNTVPGWWVPDQWCVVDALPRTTLGKPDKRQLRDMLAKGQLPITHGT
ncbi:AMP-binding protein [Actibacterium sp. XHP0104]|uniref:AMP-binding protein n=1 Tax=Actibacterium sp. XHP0104 TaxID=2984335 RepID=UPI0021E6E52F|nr:AMP-binding protein [Actibacterium sp. XHP0104]MCV2882993.1 AMP-binding protein [Actibacterium sp. XHP0104]